MNLIGCLLMISGGLIVLASLVLLAGLGQRFAFASAGLLVELLGLYVIARGYQALQRGTE